RADAGLGATDDAFGGAVGAGADRQGLAKHDGFARRGRERPGGRGEQRAEQGAAGGGRCGGVQGSLLFVVRGTGLQDGSASRCRRSGFRTLPEAVRGSSSTTNSASG